MPSYDFRCVHLPYCLKRLPDQSYVVLNRDSKPIGFRTADKLDYNAYPIAVRFKRLTKAQISKLSFNGNENPEAIYLYNDGCVPTSSATHMKRYLERLAILAKMRFIPV